MPASALAPACVGQLPSEDQGPEAAADKKTVVDDADGAIGPDGDVEIPDPLAVTGKVIDYFSANLGGTPVAANASLSTERLDPSIDVQAGALGVFSVDVASFPGISRQHAGAGGPAPIIPTARNGLISCSTWCATMVVRRSASESPVLFSPASQPRKPQSALLIWLPRPLPTCPPVGVTPVSVIDGTGRARAGFLDVPPGEYTITTTIVAGGGADETQTPELRRNRTWARWHAAPKALPSAQATRQLGERSRIGRAKSSRLAPPGAFTPWALSW
ncbi:MAG: hypothetical protein GY811_05060 [Myxococcales bacterium]|nr:hypothetical protein [Myxococcales bacterium]